jgi:GMP synthase (glutamine-hydrolysing)
VLAANPVSGIQAAEIRHGGGVFWGVQYHPEFDLFELACILERMTGVLVAEGFLRRRGGRGIVRARPQGAPRRPGPPGPRLAPRPGRGGARSRAPHGEIRNFVEARVTPHAVARGRG